MCMFATCITAPRPLKTAAVARAAAHHGFATGRVGGASAHVRLHCAQPPNSKDMLAMGFNDKTDPQGGSMRVKWTRRSRYRNPTRDRISSMIRASPAPAFPRRPRGLLRRHRRPRRGGGLHRRGQRAAGEHSLAKKDTQVRHRSIDPSSERGPWPRELMPYNLGLWPLWGSRRSRWSESDGKTDKSDRPPPRSNA